MKRSHLALAGVTWTDVEEWIEDFEKEYQVYATFCVTRQGRALGQRCGLLITLEVVGVRASGRDGFTRRFKASWPTYAHKTMPGLYLYLLHAAKESLHFQPPVHRPQVKAPAYREG